MAEFRPRPPWWGGDLQTLRNVLVRQRIDLSPWPEETLHFEMPDGTGDVLIGRAAIPPEAALRPLVILIHGLTGCEDSIHVRASARALLRAGFPVMRLNLRSAGPTHAANCRSGLQQLHPSNLWRAHHIGTAIP